MKNKTDQYLSQHPPDETILNQYHGYLMKLEGNNYSIDLPATLTETQKYYILDLRNFNYQLNKLFLMLFTAIIVLVTDSIPSIQKAIQEVGGFPNNFTIYFIIAIIFTVILGYVGTILGNKSNLNLKIYEKQWCQIQIHDSEIAISINSPRKASVEKKFSASLNKALNYIYVKQINNLHTNIECKLKINTHLTFSHISSNIKSDT